MISLVAAGRLRNMFEAATKVATYVVIPGDLDAPSEVLARDATANVGNDGPIHLCREVRIDRHVDDVATEGHTESGDASAVAVSWAAPIDWVAAALDGGIAPALASRLVVTIPWPPSAEAEMALLLARLSCSGLRPAVHVRLPAVDEVFSPCASTGFAAARWCVAHGRVGTP